MEDIISVPQQYARLKGAEWFPSLYKKPVMILGQGGIGSWLSLTVSRLGCELYLFDHDIYEPANASGQIVVESAMGKNKAEAMKELLAQLSPDCMVETFGKYESHSPTNSIVLTGFDNMAARRQAYENWKEFVGSLKEEERTGCLFMDGRLLMEQIQIITILGNRPDQMERYEKEFLFADEEVPQLDCTSKQTSHFAAKIAATMTEFLTNWSYNVDKGKVVRKVPFYHEHMGPLNMSTNEY